MLLIALGGLAVFLFGLSVTATGLDNLGGTFFRRFLARATKGVWRAVTAGTLVSAVTQSGTALAVTALSLISAGLMAFREGLAVSLGSKLGGTLAIQLAAFRIYDYALPLIAVGHFAGLWKPLSELGRVMKGVGLLFLGLDLMIRTLGGAAESELFMMVLEAAEGNLWVVAAVGVGIAMLVNSSNATVALALGLFTTGVISSGPAFALVIGGNVGSTVLPVLAASSLGTPPRRVALAHLGYKALVGVAFLLLIVPFMALITRLGGTAERQIANAHTLFNFIAVFPALLFIPLIERLMVWLVPGKSDEIGPRYLTRDALDQPEMAFSLAQRELVRISDQVTKMMSEAMKIVRNDGGNSEEVAFREEKVDRLVRSVVLYLAELQQKQRSEIVLNLLLLAGELEHTGDLIRRLLRQPDKLKHKGIEFSREGRRELSDAASKVLARMEQGFTILATGNTVLAEEFGRGRKQMENTIEKLRLTHLGRLETGLPESQASSEAHLDMLTILDGIDTSVTKVTRLAMRLGKLGAVPMEEEESETAE